MASNTELPSGYDYEFVEEVPEDYICSICQLTMRRPVQTECGHRFCKGCLDAALLRSQHCPVDRQNLTTAQVFNDLATDRQILSLKVTCSNQGCDWQGELRNAQTHVEQCALVPCKYVTVGCTFKGQTGCMDDHYSQNMEEHLSMQTEQILILEDKIKHLEKQVQPERMLALEDKIKHLKKQVQTERILALENKIKHLEKQVQTERILALEDEVKYVKKEVLTKTTSDDQSRCSYLWKINDFSKQLQLAKQQNRDITLYSEPFHTHKYGYKLKLRLYPNGNGDGKGTHVSLFMIIMHGEYDAILTWPFNWKYKFSLIDQKPDEAKQKNIETSVIYPAGVQTNDTKAFQRPTTDENPGYGLITTFLSHQTLKTENYVVDGAVFVKFESEKPCPHPSPCTVIMTKDDQSLYSFTWRINDFSKQLQLAKQQDRDIRLYSEPFHTNKYGYKMKLGLDPNGHGDGKGTHVTVFMIIMQCEYDAILTWPFNWKWKFTMLDQKPDHSTCKNIDTGYISPDTTNASYQRPTTD